MWDKYKTLFLKIEPAVSKPHKNVRLKLAFSQEINLSKEKNMWKVSVYNIVPVKINMFQTICQWKY